MAPAQGWEAVQVPVLLALRFLAEILLLASYAFGGWALGGSVATSLPLAVVLPLLAAAAWGRWVAPKAPHRLPDPARLGVELTLFAGGFVLAGRAEGQPLPLLVALAMWAMYLLSMPARRAQV
jgi:hypothetical protein